MNVNWNGMLKSLCGALRKRAPEILTGIGIGGMITTTVLAVRATPEALRRIDAEKRRLNRDRLTVKETVCVAGKVYIPAAVTGTVSTACLIGASTVNGRRNAALATAYGLAENTLRDYRAKVVETIGEKREANVLEAVDRERVARNPPPLNELAFIEGHGNVLCCDGSFGRYFYSDAESLQQAANRLNWRMNTGSESYVSLNEFYMEIGLSPVSVGDLLGWHRDTGLIDLHKSSILVDGRIPCLVISHKNPPKYDYAW